MLLSVGAFNRSFENALKRPGFDGGCDHCAVATVASADTAGGRARVEWDAIAFRTASTIAVEVKSAAYLQTWSPGEPSKVVFRTAPRVGWEASTNTFRTHYRCHSDVFVFCLLAHTNKASVDPLDTDQWRFHVLPTCLLDDKVGNQKTIGLAQLLALEPAIVPYLDLQARLRPPPDRRLPV